MNYYKKIKDVLDLYVDLKKIMKALGFTIPLEIGAVLLPVKHFVTDYWPWFLLIALFSLSVFVLSLKDKYKERQKEQKELTGRIEIMPRHDAISINNFEGITRISLYLKIVNMFPRDVQIHSSYLRFGNNIKTVTHFEGDSLIKGKSIQQIHFDDEITPEQKGLLANVVTVNGEVKLLFNGTIFDKSFTFDRVHIHG